MRLLTPIFSLSVLIPSIALSNDNVNGELLTRKPINTQRYQTSPSWYKYTRPNNMPTVATNNINQQPLDYQPTNNITPPPQQNFQQSYYNNTHTKKSHNLNISFSSGYRQDQFNWNIASDITGTATPNILSELTWKDIQFYEFRADAEYIIPNGALRGIYLNSSAYYAEGFSGDNRDSDWNLDNRQGEFSRSINDSKDATSKGTSLAIGYELDAGKLFHPNDKKLISRFTPLVGYSWQELNLLNTNGNQVIPNTGSFSGLNSSYDSKWYGPFIGFKLSSQFQKHRIGLRTEFHLADYDAEANWNLRSDFKHPKSFEQIGDGEGIKLKIDYNYQITNNWEIFANAAIESWNVKNGVDTTFLANDTISSTRLNEVNWDSQAYHLGISYFW